ncbi:MAG: hypothetical protein ABIH28_02510 [archaeon]
MEEENMISEKKREINNKCLVLDFPLERRLKQIEAEKVKKLYEMCSTCGESTSLRESNYFKGLTCVSCELEWGYQNIGGRKYDF